METRLVNLETKLSFQEETISQLNEVVITQQRTIDELSYKIEKLSKTINTLRDSGVIDISLETPPPHY